MILLSPSTALLCLFLLTIAHHFGRACLMAELSAVSWWARLSGYCKKMAAATNHTHQSAMSMTTWSLGLEGAIYAFSGEVAGLLRVIFAALDNPGPDDAGDSWGTDARSTYCSVGNDPSYW